MKKVIALSALAIAASTPAFASSYVTGNVQFHDDGRIHGSKATSTRSGSYL
ncbi:hypothetical protein JCM19241_4508 [Vibrio ishigakensis]|uniref:Uncharacterized protein n=1 Tax=Vibrio ishigakensis TaxID=1481914 RepID=A0A0B8QUN2_9VIBR|nr:hypothetical protein JCM19241_4508 [Vibrio ishigakensis]